MIFQPGFPASPAQKPSPVFVQATCVGGLWLPLLAFAPRPGFHDPSAKNQKTGKTPWKPWETIGKHRKNTGKWWLNQQWMGISLLIYVSQVGLELQFHVWVYGRHIEVENCFLASSMDIFITWLCIGVSWDHTWEIPITALLIMGNRWIINQCIYLIVDYHGKTNMGNMGNKNTSIINQLLITLITIMNQL